MPVNDDDTIAEMEEACAIFEDTKHGDDLRRWTEVLRAALAARPQADELLAIVTELAEVDPRRFTDVAPLVDVAKAATAGSATPTGDDDE